MLFFTFFSCNPHRDEPAPEPEPQVILIYGDTRTGHSAHREVVDAMMTMEPDIVFHTGDLVAHGWNPGEWVTFNEITSGLREIAAFYPALGNHEDNSMYYFQYFDLPGNERWYSVPGRGGIHFIILDSDSDTGPDSEQYKWFEAELRRVSGSVKFTVVIFHHPPFSTGPHDDEMGLRQTIVPLMEKYNVRLVFNGHNHCYERCLHNEIYYIVTGGGGAPLYRQKRTRPYSQLYIKAYHFCQLSLEGNRLKVTAYDVDLSVIDEFMVYN